jgi:hypothetical protein
MGKMGTDYKYVQLALYKRMTTDLVIDNPENDGTVNAVLLV